MPIIDPRPQTIPLQIPPTDWHPEPQPYAATIWPDISAAPNEGAKLTTWLVLALIQQSNAINQLAQQCASLAVAVSEAAKVNATVGAFQPEPHNGPAAPHNAEQHALALAVVHQIAERCKLTPPAVAPAVDEGANAGDAGDAGDGRSALDDVKLPELH